MSTVLQTVRLENRTGTSCKFYTLELLAEVVASPFAELWATWGRIGKPATPKNRQCKHKGSRRIAMYVMQRLIAEKLEGGYTVIIPRVEELAQLIRPYPSAGYSQWEQFRKNTAIGYAAGINTPGDAEPRPLEPEPDLTWKPGKRKLIKNGDK